MLQFHARYFNHMAVEYINAWETWHKTQRSSINNMKEKYLCEWSVFVCRVVLQICKWSKKYEIKPKQFLMCTSSPNLSLAHKSCNLYRFYFPRKIFPFLEHYIPFQNSQNCDRMTWNTFACKRALTFHLNRTVHILDLTDWNLNSIKAHQSAVSAVLFEFHSENCIFIANGNYWHSMAANYCQMLLFSLTSGLIRVLTMIMTRGKTPF